MRHLIRPKMVLLLLLALLSGHLGTDAIVWLFCDSSSIASLAVAATGSPTQGPDLGVTILRSGSDPRPLATPGQTITLSIGVNNLRGGGDAHSSVLTVKLPSGLTLQGADPSPDRTESGSNLVWNLGTMEAGAFPRLFELNLTVAANASPQTQLSITADVATSDREENLKNNSSSLTIFVLPAVAHLSVQSNLDAVPLALGGPVKFTAEVSNLGTIAAKGSALAITLPTGVSFRASDPAPSSTSGNTVTWSLGDIEPNGFFTITITIALSTSLSHGEFEAKPSPAGLLNFRFDASTVTTQDDQADNHLEIAKALERVGSDLKIWLNIQGADKPGELPIGKEVTYAITYGNFGNQPASQASVSLNLSEGLNLVQTEPASASSGKSDRFAGGVFSWNVGGLRIGQSSVIKCRVRVNSVPEHGSLTMATISAPEVDINPGNNVAYVHWYGPGIPVRKSSSRTLLWLVLLMVVFAAVFWMALRTWRRRSTNAR